MKDRIKGRCLSPFLEARSLAESTVAIGGKERFGKLGLFDMKRFVYDLSTEHSGLKCTSEALPAFLGLVKSRLF